MKYIALLRGINVGGRRKVKMDELKRLFKATGLTNPTTYIQSGNVIFEWLEPTAIHELEIALEKKIEAHFGFQVPVIVRTHVAMQQLLLENPFLPQEAEEKLHVTFLQKVPQSDNFIQLTQAVPPADRFKLVDNTIYLCCEGKYHQSKLSNTFFEKKLGVRATTRNWKTTQKIIELLAK